LSRMTRRHWSGQTDIIQSILCGVKFELEDQIGFIGLICFFLAGKANDQ